MVFEDIHWAEEPLLELIDHLAQWVRERSLLLLLSGPARTARTCGRAGAEGACVRRRSSLEPLAAMTRRGSSPTHCSQSMTSRRRYSARLLDKTEGNPLFVEETVRMLLEEGAEQRRSHPRLTAGADRRAHRQAAGRREDHPAARLRDRPHLLGGRDRSPVAGVRRGRARRHARRSPACATSSRASSARRSAARRRIASSTC